MNMKIISIKPYRSGIPVEYAITVECGWWWKKRIEVWIGNYSIFRRASDGMRCDTAQDNYFERHIWKYEHDKAKNE